MILGIIGALEYQTEGLGTKLGKACYAKVGASQKWGHSAALPTFGNGGATAPSLLFCEKNNMVIIGLTREVHVLIT